MKNKLPNFSGKVVSVSFVGADDTHAIENPTWKTQGGKLFLVGTIPRGGSTRDWVKGIVCAAAWDHVSDYLVFESADDYRKRLQVFRVRKRKS